MNMLLVEETDEDWNGKWCTRCRNWFRISEFYPVKAQNGRSPRHTSECKECTKKRRAIYIAKPGKREMKNAADRKYTARPEVKERAKAARKKYVDKKSKDPLWVVTRLLRARIRNSINLYGFTKKSSTAEILGCTYEEALKFLGPNKKGTEIDHIIPMSWAKTKEEAEALNCIWNLRRISKKENREKMDKAPEPELLHPNLPQLALDVYEREKHK